NNHFYCGWTTTSTRYPGCFFKQKGRWGGLHNESETTVTVYNNYNWHRNASFQTLGLGVKSFTEFHDVHTVLTQSWTNRRTWICFASCNLQLDIGGYFLCHCRLPIGC